MNLQSTGKQQGLGQQTLSKSACLLSQPHVLGSVHCAMHTPSAMLEQIVVTCQVL